jgi:hypothetical protein
MARLTRAGSFRRKTGLRLSKSETALEAAFKEKDIEVVGDVATLEISRVPDAITVATLSQSCVIDIVVPAADPQAAQRIVTVYNASANTVALSVGGGTAATALAAGKTGVYLIADTSGEATTVPAILYVQA